jgi:uncharacterized protein YceK
VKSAALLLAAVAILVSGCSHVATRKASGADLGHYRKVFVEHRLSDGRNLDEIMARELTALGYEASAGPLTMMPHDSEVIVAYEDQWAWDFNTYMIGLDVSVRNSRNDQILATAHVYRPSNVFGTAPEKMIDDVLRSLFPSR